MENILIIGMGISGVAAAEVCLRKGFKVTGFDDKIPATDAMDHLKNSGCALIVEEERLEFERFTKLIVSPGVPSDHPLLVRAKKCGLEVVGEVEFALQELKGFTVLGITGTNGKTTVTLLVEHVLLFCGFQAKAFGNVGTPLSAGLSKLAPEQIIVLELSSYQIETLSTRALDAATILNITPDHLDRYGTMRSYAAAKCKLQSNLKEGGPFYVFENVAAEYSDLLFPGYITYGCATSSDYIIDDGNIKHGKQNLFSLPASYTQAAFHDKMNVLAAWLLCQRVGVSYGSFCQALQTFTKPHHRIEFVKTCAGVDYIDDSKGTNVDAVVQAVASIGKPVILIAGGVDKGSSYFPWQEAFKGKVKKMIVLGQASDKIVEELGSHFPIMRVPDMEKAVQEAKRQAREGDAVLLSPGCSSFDMFRDYVHRGQEFQKYVNLLKE